MRTTVTIDDELYQRAVAMLAPGKDKSEVFREAMSAFVRLEAAKRLAALGGQAPAMPDVARRQPSSTKP